MTIRIAITQHIITLIRPVTVVQMLVFYFQNVNKENTHVFEKKLNAFVVLKQLNFILFFI